jgi:predicted transcriptional regulator
MRAAKVITDPKAFELLGDETRRRIIYLLRAKEMTVSQISAEMHLTTQAIYHHIRKLKDAGMVEVAREERVAHFIETYYEASAEVFHLDHGKKTSKEDAESQVRLALEGLSKLGYEVDCSKAAAARLVKASKAMDECCSNEELTEKVAKLEDVDFVTGQTIVEYASLLAMTDQEFDEHLRRYRALREQLKTCAKPGRPAVRKGKAR